MNIIKPFIFPYNEVLKIKLNNSSMLNIIDSDFDISFFCLFVNCGSNNEAINNDKIINGLAHLIEHIIFTDNDLITTLTYNNCNYNASTSDNLTSFYFECLNKDLIKYVDLFFDIFLNIDNQFKHKIIKSQIQAITNENIKNFNIDILKILNIVKNISDNKLFSRDNCGNYTTLDIPNIIDFAKLFFITYYIPVNFRFVVFTNTKINTLDNVKRLFNYFSNFYTQEFLKIKLSTNNINFNSRINQEITNQLLLQEPFIKTTKTILFHNNKKNELYLFFNCKTLNQEYINFMYWLFNKEDKYGLKETLNKYFNVIDFSFNSTLIFNNKNEKYYICFLNIIFPFSSSNRINEILEFIYSFIEDFKQLDDNTFENVIEYYKICKCLECLYFNDFSSHSINIITNTIQNNIEIDFYTNNILLDNFTIDFDYKIKEIKDLIKQLDFNNCLTFINLNEKETLPNITNKTIKFINNFTINYSLNNSTYKYSKTYNFTKEYFILSDNDRREYNKIIKISNGYKNKTLTIKQNENDLVNLFNQHYTINKINVNLGFSNYYFHITSTIHFYLNYQKNKDIKYQIINCLIIFEYIKHELNNKYSFLNTTDFILFYKIDKLDYKFTFYIHCLTEYYFSVFTDLINSIKEFKYSHNKKIIDNEFNRIYEKVRYNINNIIDDDKFKDKYFINQLFNKNYVILEDIVDLLDYLQFNKLDYQLINLNFKNIEITTILNNSKNKEDNLTMFLNNLSLLTENLLNQISNDNIELEYNTISDFNNIKIICKNKDKDTIIRNGFYNNILNLNKNIITTKTENYILSFCILIPITNIYLDTFILDTIKNLIFNDYFNIFRTEKKYCYTLYIRNQIINQNINVFKLFMIVNNQLINDTFIFNIYNEIRTFLYQAYKNLKNLTFEILNKQKINYLLEYKKIHISNLLNVINYDKIKQKYKNIIDYNKYKDLINKITIDNIKDYYKKYFIDTGIKLLIVPIKR